MIGAVGYCVGIVFEAIGCLKIFLGVAGKETELKKFRLAAALIFGGAATPTLMIWIFSALARTILVN